MDEVQVKWLLELDESSAADWSIIDDQVMGGRSQGRWSFEEGTAVFSGWMTTENNGGFSSVRSGDREWGMGGVQGVVIRVRGDGQTYKLGLRVDGQPVGVTYQANFVAGKEWANVQVPWGDLVPRWRGRIVKSVGPIDPARVRSVGFLISDGQEGAFRLELSTIGVWRTQR